MAPTARQLRQWMRRLYDLTAEMEAVYGEPGQCNQDPLDAAVHVAYYVACHEVRLAEQKDELRFLNDFVGGEHTDA